MITINEKNFKIDTKNTSYILGVSQLGHLLNYYYGAKIDDDDYVTITKQKYSCSAGTNTNYDESNYAYSLDLMFQEISTVGKGDYKEPSIVIDNGKDYILDLKYHSHVINEKHARLTTLPSFYKDLPELVVTLKDTVLDIFVELHYLVDYENDVIARNIVVINKMSNDLWLEKAMSFNLDMVNKQFELISLFGGWAFEGQKSKVLLNHNTYVNDSKTGNSSNRHNPFFLLKRKDASYNYGDVYAFNLVYSGNHCEIVEHTNFNNVRIQSGINPHCFRYKLQPNDLFETPFAILTYSSLGTNGASGNMHEFIKEYVQFKNVCAPILINNWEATYMNFKTATLHKIIDVAKQLKLEMFVLDDGWFGRRKDDFNGLGDYDINTKKLRGGLKGIASYANGKKMKFGLWFEPEMVNVNSKLYETHPEWVMKSDQREPSFGRHQLVLDLSKKEVQDYVIENVNHILDTYNVEYVKWDMNRHMSDVSSDLYHAGELPHRYIIGLYRVFSEIVLKHPKVFFEGCASGGNRFDLGILSFFDQIWTSDDTDAYERISIQSGYAMGYPLKCISNHVSADVSHSPLRHTPIDTRFNVACFGALGYEMDLSTLLPVEVKAVKEQVKFYKNHRKLIKDGTFYQLKDIKEDNVALWLVVSKDKSQAILGYFNGLQVMNPTIDEIKLVGLDENKKYLFQVRQQNHNIQKFGSLINQILPVRVNERGAIVRMVSKYKTIDGEMESYVISGKALHAGALKLDQQWMGTGIGNDVRVLGDFGSRLYYIKAIDEQPE